MKQEVIIGGENYEVEHTAFSACWRCAFGGTLSCPETEDGVLCNKYNKGKNHDAYFVKKETQK